MPYVLQRPDQDPPEGYITLGANPPIPGADWYVEGRRYREVNRTDDEDGGYTLTLERADIEPLYSFVDPEETL